MQEKNTQTIYLDNNFKLIYEGSSITKIMSGPQTVYDKKEPEKTKKD